MSPDPTDDPPVLDFAPIQNAALLETMYERWKRAPETLDPAWRTFFQGFDLASCPHTCRAAEQAALQSRVASLIYAYRNVGHVIARLDPLGNNPDHHPDLELERFGLSEAHLKRTFDAGHLQGLERGTLEEIIAQALGQGRDTKGVRDEYLKLVSRFGSEFRVLLDLPEEELAPGTPPKVLSAIRKVRAGELEIRPGYDGVYGEIRIPLDEGPKELSLF